MCENIRTHDLCQENFLPNINSFAEQRRKCGKLACRCATGKPHVSMMLRRSEQGRTKLMTIPSGELKDLRVLTERYQKFRRARARLGRIYKTMVKLIDQLEEARRKEP